MLRYHRHYLEDKLRRLIFLTFFLIGITPAAANDSKAGSGLWRSVEEILSRPGTEQGDVFRIDIPRDDLNVTVQGAPLETGLALVSRFYFKALPKGTLLWGDLVLLEQEVPRVTALMIQNGFQTAEVHSFLPNESPAVKMLHIRGRSSRANLARALKRVLSVKPLFENSEKSAQASPASGLVFPPAAKATPIKSPVNDWESMEAVLGQGTVEGKILHYEYPLGFAVVDNGVEIPPFMGMESDLRFQKVQGTSTRKKNFWNFGKGSGVSKELAAGTGVFLVTPDQVAPVKEILTRNHAVVTEVRELQTSPKVFSVYFWVLGQTSEVAQGLHDVLNQVNRGKSN